MVVKLEVFGKVLSHTDQLVSFRLKVEDGLSECDNKSLS